MNIKFSLKNIWLAVAVSSLILLAFHWFGFDSRNLEYAILTLSSVAFILSLPCSLFVVPVMLASNYYMAISPFAGDGIYLGTILIFIVGAMQWFWIVNFWYPTESSFQDLDLLKAKID